MIPDQPAVFRAAGGRLSPAAGLFTREALNKSAHADLIRGSLAPNKEFGNNKRGNISIVPSPPEKINIPPPSQTKFAALRRQDRKIVHIVPKNFTRKRRGDSAILTASNNRRRARNTGKEKGT